MTLAATLPKAAGLAADNINVHWINNSLKSRLTQLWQNSLASFGDSDVNSRPVSNWLTVLSVQADQMPSTNVPIEQVSAASQTVYRLCWMGSALLTSGGITAGQAADLLAAYNAALGTP